MSIRDLTLDDVKAAVRGGSVFASGGGGWVPHGLDIGETAVRIGRPRLVSIDELDDEDIIITVSAIGAPAATGWQMLAADYIKSVRLLQEQFPKRVVGTITPQNGCSSSINGWVQSAALGLVVVDAVGDMRAHPTGKMGSLGLAGDNSYETIQVVVGGKRETGSYVEVVAKGTIAKTSNILRAASEQAGNFVTCARHPLPARVVKERAALGGISRAITLGEAMLDVERQGGQAVVQAIVKTAHAQVLGQGRVLQNTYETKGAFDLGKAVVDTGEQKLTLHIMNEWMAVDDQDGKRLTTYPDVITVVDASTGLPLNVFEVTEDREVVVLSIHKKHIPLSAGVFDPTVYPEVEAALNISIAGYALENTATQPQLVTR